MVAHISYRTIADSSLEVTEIPHGIPAAAQTLWNKLPPNSQAQVAQVLATLVCRAHQSKQAIRREANAGAPEPRR